MKHSLLKIAAAAVMTCAAWTVSAANPFADVDESSWAYKAVSQLSEDNVIDGYPDGTFRGDKNVSRYELAQIIARLMQKENLSDSQKATVQKLSAKPGRSCFRTGKEDGKSFRHHRTPRPGRTEILQYFQIG